jgi:DNA polymerase III epsilon subunit-like protein
MKTNLLYLDTETTGNTHDDRLCQIAYILESPGNALVQFESLYNPEKKIPPEASAVTHITNKMVVDQPTFKSSSQYPEIKKLVEDQHTVFIAHNAVFDIAILKNDDIVVDKFICTLRVARHLDPEGKIPRYNLQYLRYFLEIEIDAPAHDALGDVLVLRELFPRLYRSVARELSIDVPEVITEYNDQIITAMIEISSHPSIMRSFTFGKYIGKTVEEVSKIDRGYLQWMLNEKQKNPSSEEDWIYTLKYFLNNKNPQLF